MDKIRDGKIFSKAMGFLFSFGGGFLFSGTNLGGIDSFADISLTGAVGFPYGAAVFSGAVVRCVLTDSVGKCVVKLCAMALIIAVKMFSEIFNRPVASGILTGVSSAVSGCVISALIGEFPRKLIFYLIYGIIAGVTAYSGAELRQGIATFSVIDLKGKKGCLAGIVYIVASASICSVEFPYFNGGLVLLSAVTAGAAYFFGGFGGVVIGALGASGAILSSSEIGTAAAILPTAGLIAGFGGRDKFLLSAFMYTASVFFLGILMGGTYNFGYALSLVIGGGIFVAVAPYLKEKQFIMRMGRNENSHESKAVRNNFLSDVIDAVRCDSGKISAAISANRCKENKGKEYTNNVCGACYRRGICSGSQGEISGEIIPVIPEDCVRRKDAADEFERLFRLRTAHRIMELRYSEERRFLSEQFRIISDIIRESGEKCPVRHSHTLEQRIENSLKNHNIKYLRVMAGYTETERITAEIFFSCGEIADSAERICGILSDTLGVRLLASAAVSSSKELKIGIYQPAEYEAEIHTASKCASGCKISGDSASIFTDSRGNQFIVLSDGMGSGKNAAVDSHMVIGMFRRLVCGGMKPQSAVRVVNSVMVTKSREESFATLDALIFNPDSCRVLSVKSGAAPTIIRKGGDVVKLSSTVFPIGIIEEAELYETEHKLSEGDMIIMFSDGITENAYLFIKELLLGGSDIREIVREIAVKADVFNPNVRSDDVTVIGVKILKR